VTVACVNSFTLFWCTFYVKYYSRRLPLLCLCAITELEQQEGDSKNETDSRPKYDDPYAETPTRFRSLSAVETSRTDVEPTILSSSFTDSVSVSSDGKLCPGLNGKESPSRHVSESSGSTSVPEVNGEGHDDTNGSATDIASSGQAEVDMSGTYDEPWDLRAARLGLENRLRAAQGPNPASTMQQLRYESRYRTMDPRPAMEYDEPWDRRAKDVQRTLISAKSAKEEARVLREGHGAASRLPMFSSSTCRVQPNASRHFDRSSSKHGVSAGISYLKFSEIDTAHHVFSMHKIFSNFANRIKS